jgi:hypothetical protein
MAGAWNSTPSTSSTRVQITYGYVSLLPTDALYGQHAAGVAPTSVRAVGAMDRHFKPMEPPAVRLTLSGPLSFWSSRHHAP